MSSDNQLRNIFESITKNIDDDMDDFAPLKTAAGKVHMQPSHLVLVSIVAILILTALGVFQHIFVTLFGLLYPAYMSFKVSLSLLRPSTMNPIKRLRVG